MLSDIEKQQIDLWIAKFPAGQERSAVIMALRIVQDNRGCLTNKAMQDVADYLLCSFVEVAEVASFYSLYRTKPQGRFTIKVCDSLSCCMRGSEEVSLFLQKELGVGLNQTTDDGCFTLAKTECLAACTQAPVVIVNDKDYHGPVTKSQLRTMLQRLREEHESDT